MKTNLFRKIASIFVSLAFIVSMAVPVLAIKDSDKGKIKINGLENVGNVELYQVINVDYDFDNDQPKDPAFYWNTKVGDWLKTNDNNKLKSYISSENANYEVTNIFINLDANGNDMKLFVDQMSAAINNGKITGLSPTTSLANSSGVEFAELSMGAYLGLVKGGVKVYNPIFTSIIPEYVKESIDVTDGWIVSSAEVNASVETKSMSPNIVKNVSNQNVAVGDKVKYTLTVTVPQYLPNALNKKFIIFDELPSDLNLVLESVSIYSHDASNTNRKNLMLDDNDNDPYFTLEKISNNFIFNVIENKYDDLLKVIQDGKKLTVEYQVEVKNYQASYTNTATLKYNNAPYSSSNTYSEDTASSTVYTYSIKASKVNENDVALAGAEFNLYSKNGNTETLIELTETNGVYRPVFDNTETVADSLVVNTNGELLIQGIKAGTYVLKETKAPAGYSIPRTPDTTINLVDDDTTNGTLDTWDESTKTGTNVSGLNVKAGTATITANQLSFKIVNYKNDFNLPNTGGMGTMLFTVVGIMIMGGAVVMMIAVAKKKKEQ